MKKILMIDNFDSFTYNVVHYLEELGARVVVYRNNKITCDDVARMKPQAIVISPGPCTPNEAGVSMDVIRTFSGKIPILGVCLGHQAIGQVFGGTIVRARRIMHGKISPITHRKKGIFKGLPSPFMATRYHSLLIDKASCPRELEIVAKSDTGEIMGVQHRDHPTYGVQFHPESIKTEHGHRLLKNFLAIAEGFKKKK